MKNIILLTIAVIVITFASCENKTHAGAGIDSDTTVTELSTETQTTLNSLTGKLTNALQAKDAQRVISALANLETIYKNLVESGKLKEAEHYGTAIKDFVTKNAKSIKSIAAGNTIIASLVDGIRNLPTTVSTTAEAAKSAVASNVVNFASPTIVKGVTAVANAKAAAETIKKPLREIMSTAETAVRSAKTTTENKVKENAKSSN